MNSGVLHHQASFEAVGRMSAAAFANVFTNARFRASSAMPALADYARTDSTAPIDTAVKALIRPVKSIRSSPMKRTQMFGQNEANEDLAIILSDTKNNAPFFKFKTNHVLCNEINDVDMDRSRTMRHCKPLRGLVATAALMCAIGLAPHPTAAQPAEDFYRGKTMTVIIPIGPGGAYDAYARLVSRHLGRQLPGNPTIVARNMPGAGGVIASNYLYNTAPQDGTTLAIITSAFANEQLFGNPQIKYDARQFQAVGRLLDTTSVLFFWHASSIKTLNDMLSKPAAMAISSVNEVPAYRLNAMNRHLGTKFKAIPGYPSARDYVLAVERGETDGGSSTFIGLSQLFSSYLQEKKLNILVQFALQRDANMRDVPTVLELARDADATQVFRHLVSNDEIGRSLFTSPHIPPARLALLRAAFQRMLVDADFRAEALQLKLPLAPKTGEEMQRIVADVFNITPEAMEKVREVSR